MTVLHEPDHALGRRHVLAWLGSLPAWAPGCASAPEGVVGAPVPAEVAAFSGSLADGGLPRGWEEYRVRRDIPEGANLVVREVISETTASGWPTNVLDIQIVDSGAAAPGKSSASSSAQAGRLLEQRITTCYRFLEYCVIAEVRARDLAMLMELKDQLRALLAEGRPDWSGSDTSVRRLLDGTTR